MKGCVFLKGALLAAYHMAQGSGSICAVGWLLQQVEDEGGGSSQCLHALTMPTAVGQLECGAAAMVRVLQAQLLEAVKLPSRFWDVVKSGGDITL
ncbi:UNVERIFIED_CONTAM: hypothetical protein K2H54_055022 [Gekko kuhli]